jgi:hypothetical protein
VHHEEFIKQCEKDYCIAEITAVAHRYPQPYQWTHLLAVVELLHSDLEPNPLIGLHPPDGYPRRCNLGRRAGTLFVQRWVLNVREGLDWYLGCETGSIQVPGPPGSAGSTKLQVGPLGLDPPWPHHVIEVKNFWEDSGFWGNRPGGSRWHRMLPLTPVEVSAGWEAADFVKAREFLLREVHIDLFSRSVLLGSCHLSLPNPVYRCLCPHVSDDSKTINFELIPFSKQSPDPLELTFWGRRAWGATEVRRLPLVFGANLLNVPEGVEEVAHAVESPTRGLLEQSEMVGFISSVKIEMNLITEQRRVQGSPSRESNRSDGYTVGVVGHTSDMLIGDARRVNALSRLAADEEQRAITKAWSGVSVQWFDNESVRGAQAIRDIIGRGSRRIDLLDPYFGRKDLQSFALATTRHGLPVRILTSADFCSGGSDSELNIERGDALLQILELVRSQDARFKIEIKVMAGPKSPVHDRFLIVDDTVWVLGASLNEFGNRGTILMRLPAPPGIEAGGVPAFSISKCVFDKHWDRPEPLSMSLKEWVVRRVGERATPSRSFVERLRSTRNLVRQGLGQLRRVWSA